MEDKDMERQRVRETQRNRDRYTESNIGREEKMHVRGRQTDRHACMQEDRQTDTHTHTHTHTHRLTDRQTDRQTD